eukprot:SAG31_NODE_3897_length_3772_cov_2.529540_3_plen_149_part_00
MRTAFLHLLVQDRLEAAQRAEYEAAKAAEAAEAEAKVRSPRCSSTPKANAQHLHTCAAHGMASGSGRKGEASRGTCKACRTSFGVSINDQMTVYVSHIPRRGARAPSPWTTQAMKGIRSTQKIFHPPSTPSRRSSQEWLIPAYADRDR